MYFSVGIEYIIIVASCIVVVLERANAYTRPFGLARTVVRPLILLSLWSQPGLGCYPIYSCKVLAFFCLHCIVLPSIGMPWKFSAKIGTTQIQAQATTCPTPARLIQTTPILWRAVAPAQLYGKPRSVFHSGTGVHLGAPPCLRLRSPPG
jgi:hypothetical protein